MTTAASAAGSPERSGPEPWPASSGSYGRKPGGSIACSRAAASATRATSTARAPAQRSSPSNRRGRASPATRSTTMPDGVSATGISDGDAGRAGQLQHVPLAAA